MLRALTSQIRDGQVYKIRHWQDRKNLADKKARIRWQLRKECRVVIWIKMEITETKPLKSGNEEFKDKNSSNQNRGVNRGAHSYQKMQGRRHSKQSRWNGTTRLSSRKDHTSLHRSKM